MLEYAFVCSADFRKTNSCRNCGVEYRQMLSEILSYRDTSLSDFWVSFDLGGVLAEAEMLMGGKKVSLDDFYTLLADGLEATEIAPNPLLLDAVFVGDITDSRIERIRVLFALGMTDALPRASDDANLITDQDKRKLEAIETVLEPMVEEVNKRNRESMALNLCAFTDKLYLIYSLGSNGEEPALSDVFRYVGEVFLTTAGLPIAREKGIAKADFAYRCSALAPAVRQLLLDQ